MENKDFFVISIFYTVVLLFACVNTENTNSKIKIQNSPESITETNSFDPNNNFDEIKIGTQTWAIKNLNVSTFRDGDPIPEAKTTDEWGKANNNKEPVWCYYDNAPKNGKKYGKLYNWYAVIDSRGLAPKGWHIPNNAEWTTLTDFLGGEFVSGTGTKMKSASGWEKNGNGSNESGFLGLPGGLRNYNGPFNDIDCTGNWWSSSEYSSISAWSLSLYYFNSDVKRGSDYKEYGLSVRCLRD